MPTLKESAEQFLQLNTIAVAGVSSTKKDAANYIYEKLKKTGYQVFAVNPNAKEIDGDSCFPNLESVPDRIEGVVIGTNPKVTLSIVKECAKLGIQYVWIHKSLDRGSYSDEAELFCKEHGINLIPTGCPMMFCKPVDFAHKCIKWVLHATGKMPRTYN